MTKKQSVYIAHEIIDFFNAWLPWWENDTPLRVGELSKLLREGPGLARGRVEEALTEAWETARACGKEDAMRKVEMILDHIRYPRYTLPVGI